MLSSLLKPLRPLSLVYDGQSPGMIWLASDTKGEGAVEPGTVGVGTGGLDASLVVANCEAAVRRTVVKTRIKANVPMRMQKRRL